MLVEVGVEGDVVGVGAFREDELLLERGFLAAGLHPGREAGRLGKRGVWSNNKLSEIQIEMIESGGSVERAAKRVRC